MVRTKKDPKHPVKAAVPLLDAWLTANDLKLHPWCESVGIDRIAMLRLFHGERTRVSVDLALAVERATEGAVKAHLWCTEAKTKKPSTKAA